MIITEKNYAKFKEGLKQKQEMLTTQEGKDNENLEGDIIDSNIICDNVELMKDSEYLHFMSNSLANSKNAKVVTKLNMAKNADNEERLYCALSCNDETYVYEFPKFVNNYYRVSDLIAQTRVCNYQINGMAIQEAERKEKMGKAQEGLKTYYEKVCQTRFEDYEKDSLNSWYDYFKATENEID